MAKQIVSIKIPLTFSGGFTLRRVIRLFETIRKCRCKAYFSNNGSTYPIKNLPQTVTYLSSVKAKEILLVLEGEDAEPLHQKIMASIQNAQENARENPGLYRHG
jgi:phosphotransferase system HPr-like phosphotransfer protein